MGDTGTGALTVAEADELAGHEEAMSDTRSWHQPHNQPARDRVQALYEKQVSGEPAPAAQGATAKRLGALEALMSDRLSDYWRGPRSEALQNEYRRLLEGGELADVSADTVTTWASALGVSEPDMTSGFARAAQIEAEVGDLGGAFDGLPGTAQERETRMPLMDAFDACGNWPCLARGLFIGRRKCRVECRTTPLFGGILRLSAVPPPEAGVPLAVDQWYDFHEFGCHLGNVG